MHGSNSESAKRIGLSTLTDHFEITIFTSIYVSQRITARLIAHENIIN